MPEVLGFTLLYLLYNLLPVPSVILLLVSAVKPILEFPKFSQPPALYLDWTLWPHFEESLTCFVDFGYHFILCVLFGDFHFS